MNILLSTLNSKFIHTALSLRYLKAFAEKKERECIIEISEFTINQNINHIIGELYRKNPDVLCFSVYIWNVNEILDVSRALKLVRPDLKIALGGPEVSFEIRELMEKEREIDYVLYGEGEEAFSEFVDYLEGKKGIEGIRNIVYRREDSGEIVINPPRPVMKDLGDIPEIYGEDLSEYEDKIIYYESSRGCPFSCKFCLSSTIDGVRFFPIDRVLKELKIFIDGRVKQVKFIDRTFNAKVDYSKKIMDYIYDNDNGVSNFHFEVTAHLIDDKFIEFLSKMPEGLFQFEIGVQSTNDRTISDVARTTDFEKLSDAVRKIKALGNIHLHLDLIAGLPYEGYESFRNSFNDVYNLNPDKLQLGFLKLLKGSAMRAESEKHGFKFLDKSPYEILETKYMSYGEMLKLKDIEELVEIYGNESNFEKTLSIAIEDYGTPFDFYEKFSLYCRRTGFYEAARGKAKQYRVLYDFLIEENILDKELIKDMLRFDFAANTKNPNIPDFLRPEGDQADREERLKDMKLEFASDDEMREKYFPWFTERDRNKMIRFVYADEFSYDLLGSGREQKKCSYAFAYNKPERAIAKSTVIEIL